MSRANVPNRQKPDRSKSMKDWCSVIGWDKADSTTKVVFVLSAIVSVLALLASITWVVGGILFAALFLGVSHFVLRTMGKRGFFKKTVNSSTNKSSYAVEISENSFKNVSS